MDNETAAARGIRPYAPTALMIGNFVTGIALLAPTAMLGELSSGLGVTIRDAGLLITFGAIVLCIGSPVTAWLTSRMERRHLLMGAVAVVAAANFASAFAPNYAALLLIRLLMAAVAALYTPQAAGTVALIVPLEKRGGSIAYVFLGWTLAAAVGLPLVTFIASRYGWREVYSGIGALSCLSLLLLAWRLPRGLYGTPVDLKTWIDLARNRLVVLLLLVTTLQISGQFVIFTFLAPLLGQLTGAGPNGASVIFAIYGLSGLVGIMTATRIVDGWGALNTSLLATVLVLGGMTVWSFGAGALPVMAVGVAIWGTGFGATNSMQQVRLVGAAPSAASASVSLNTSVLYIGQAIGSAIGGLLFAGGHFHAAGFVAMGFLTLALIAVLLSRGMVATAQR
ncbi:MFS transporter [Tardiphaga sp.]|uniref:MFS transporter n=1 Tax=Tardiphaga sp. TaxID=1926292 RepID=UPI00260E475A|nr:MFS transporter [Tardiphaga sp.]MDB5616081.1 major facilitator superfamily transporter [Tardiphaga sp.]